LSEKWVLLDFLGWLLVGSILHSFRVLSTKKEVLNPSW